MKPNILLERYELGRLLGQGTFAKVYYATNLKTGENVAIKAMDKEKIREVRMIDQIKREISVIRLVGHPNIVRLYEVMATKSKIYIVMEYVKGGELFNRVVEKRRLNEREAKKHFQQLISAVDLCHSRGVYHRDLKPENVLLDDSGNVKVSDFGFSALPEQFRQDGLLHTACVGLLDDVDSAFFTPEPACLNAFDIISRSPGFSLSGLFKDNVVKQEKESRFTSTEPASSIMSKLEEIARLFRFSCKMSKDCKVKLQGSEEGRKGHLCIDAEIFEVTPSLFVVDLRKTDGDTLEYSEFCIQELRPSLKDIVSKWEGDHSVD